MAATASVKLDTGLITRNIISRGKPHYFRALDDESRDVDKKNSLSHNSILLLRYGVTWRYVT